MSGRSPRWISVKKAPTGFTVAITGTLNATYGYVTINGTKYTSAAEVQVNAGDEISVYVASNNTRYNSFCWVQKDGTQVQTGSGTYTFTAEQNATIAFTRNQLRQYYYWTATITTS